MLLLVAVLFYVQLMHILQLLLLRVLLLVLLLLLLLLLRYWCTCHIKRVGLYFGSRRFRYLTASQMPSSCFILGNNKTKQKKA